jgi:hypothetical protein
VSPLSAKAQVRLLLRKTGFAETAVKMRATEIDTDKRMLSGVSFGESPGTVYADMKTRPGNVG